MSAIRQRKVSTTTTVCGLILAAPLTYLVVSGSLNRYTYWAFIFMIVVSCVFATVLTDFFRRPARRTTEQEEDERVQANLIRRTANRPITPTDQEKNRVPVASSAGVETATCPNGHTIPSTARFCRFCGVQVAPRQDNVVFAAQPQAAPESTALEAAPEGLSLPPQVSPRLVLGGLHVLDGAGWAPSVGSRVALLLYTDRFDLVVADGSEILSSVQLETLQDLTVEGHSSTSGSRLIGGGFGAKGAVEGMLIASAVNSITKKTQRWVIIRVVSDEGWGQFQLNDADESTVRSRLRVLADLVVARRSAKSKIDQNSLADGDVVSEIERLVKLRDSGALNDEEFRLAKKRLLGAPEETAPS